LKLIEAGDLTEERYESYLKLKKEITANELRKSAHALKQQGKAFGSLVKEAKALKARKGKA
jgi:hypothetical protein